MYRIIRLDTKEELAAGISSGEDAALLARHHSRLLGIKCQPRKMLNPTDQNWKSRERERFLSNAYTRTPWEKYAWFRNAERTAGRFPHMSKDKEGRIAYTENEEKGMSDIQTVIRPGRYLKAFYSDILRAADIKKYAAECLTSDPSLVKFARTADEIEWVYTHGPDSCMSKEKSAYNLPLHPVRAYGNSDLSIAYVLNDSKKRVRARCVVWEEKKIAGRLYGDGVTLMDALKLLDYKFHTAPYRFEGAKLTAIELLPEGSRKKGFLAPYIDGYGYGKLDEKRAKITIMPAKVNFKKEKPEIHFCQAGFCRPVLYCDNPTCGNPLDTNRVVVIDKEEHEWCLSCLHKVNAQSWDGKFYPLNDCISVKVGGPFANGQIWPKFYAEKHAFMCPQTGHWFHKKDGIYFEGKLFSKHGLRLYQQYNLPILEEKTVKKKSSRKPLRSRRYPANKKR